MTGALEKVVRLSRPRLPSGFIELFNPTHDEHGRFGFGAGDRIVHTRTGQGGHFVRAGRPAGYRNPRTGAPLPSPTHIVHFDGNSRDSHVLVSDVRPAAGTAPVPVAVPTPGPTRTGSMAEWEPDSKAVGSRVLSGDQNFRVISQPAQPQAAGKVPMVESARTSPSQPIDPYLPGIQSRAQSFYADPKNDIFMLAPASSGWRQPMTGLITSPQTATLPANMTPDDNARAAAVSQVDNQMKDFYNNPQNSPRSIDPTSDSYKASRRQEDGIGMMSDALNSGKAVIMATHDGVPTSVMSFDRLGDGSLHVGVIGSNGLTDGAATAVQVEAARQALVGMPFGDTSKTAVGSYALEDAAGYHAKIGRVMSSYSGDDGKPTPGSGDSAWTLGDVRKIAGLNVGGGL
jgi:hypothetical protein